MQNRVALITGGARGIGRGIAESFVKAGARVMIADLDSRPADWQYALATSADLEATVQEQAAYGEISATNVDVTNAASCAAAVAATVEIFGGLDVLVNNAGVGILSPLQELSVEDWETQIHTNLRGVFCCSKAAVPHLKSTEGWIINIGSLAGRNPFAGGSGYNASKFGLIGMTEAMMLDLRHSGIRVSMVMPGSVDTRFGGDYPEGGRAWALGAGDVASAVLHLLSYPDNAHVSRVEMRPSRPPKK